VDLQCGWCLILILNSGLFLWILEKKCYFFLNFGCAIPDVLDRRLSEAKSAEEGSSTPLLIAKYEPDTVKTDRDNDVTKWWLSILGEKCQVCDVTLGGGRVVFTSGFLFPVGLDLYCLNCWWDSVGKGRKIAKSYFGALFWHYFLQVWHAIPDVHGRQLRFAQLAEEGRCVTLRPPNVNYFRLDLTGLLSLDLGDFQFFRFRGSWGNNFFSKFSK